MIRTTSCKTNTGHEVIIQGREFIGVKAVLPAAQDKVLRARDLVKKEQSAQLGLDIPGGLPSESARRQYSHRPTASCKIPANAMSTAYGCTKGVVHAWG